MRHIPIAILALLPTSVALAQSIDQKTDKSVPSGKLFPLKPVGAPNSCAAYGPDYVKVEGSEMCVQISGSVSIGVGGYSRSR